MDGPIVIVGGGHAGVQLCAALVDAGQGTRIHLVCAEPELPYQRPPLSKSFLKQDGEVASLHRAAGWFEQSGITLHLGDAVTSIDRVRSRVRLTSGGDLPYDWLVLAPGAEPRRPAALAPGIANVAVLRTAADARSLREQLVAASSVTVLGGGFIGLEVAATARMLGKAVTVLEAAPRLLMRSVSATLSEHVLQVHRAAGIDVRLGEAARGFTVAGGRVTAVETDGRLEPVELLVLGMGAIPAQALAQQAGLVCGNGIEVDARMRTSDPRILAIGDVAAFPWVRREARIRLESVQNANDQARVAASSILGGELDYRPVPWFWSEQGALRLQMVGLLDPSAVTHRRPGAGPSSFSLLHYEGNRLVCVESVNAPVDHMAARRLIELGRHPQPADACDPGKALRSFT